MQIVGSSLVNGAGEFDQAALDALQGLLAYQQALLGLSGAFGGDSLSQNLKKQLDQIDANIKVLVESFAAEIVAAGGKLNLMAVNVSAADTATEAAVWQAMPDLPDVPKPPQISS
jgi:hypothetical protein